MHTHTCVNYRIWGLWANGAAVTAGYICDGFWVSIRRSSSSPASLRSWLQARHADAHAYTLTTARPAEAETCDWSSTYWPDVNRVRRITNWREPNSSAAQSLLHYMQSVSPKIKPPPTAETQRNAFWPTKQLCVPSYTSQISSEE